MRPCWVGCLSFSLEPAAVAGDSDGVVHDHLADAEVAVEPLLDVFVVCKAFCLETGARSREWVLLASVFLSCF
jgi:hypothetical protein